ncbi:MAG: DUF192 domain-containing protein [Candidatus Azambacteria bacterium]|nr:DUF192 domain-containing protein [Candidatus Azambacteria bacterium]
MVRIDSKRPFYFVSAILILGLLGIIFYFQYQKILDKKSVTIITGVGPVKIRVEFAKTPEEWQKGLMNRISLAKNSGMLFIFPEEKTREFWMKDTLIPLDIIFISSKGRVNEIITLNPCQESEICQPYSSISPAQYVLEINAGSATKLRIIEGDLLEIPKK